MLCCLLMASSIAKAQDPHWTCDERSYEYSMTLYVSASLYHNEITEFENYEIGAFCGEECRGLLSKQKTGDLVYGYLRVRSNAVNGETVTFKLYDKQNEKVIPCSNTVPFVANERKGYPSEPYQLYFGDGYIVSVESSNIAYGTVTGGGVYDSGSQVTVQAYPHEGCRFEKWSNGVTDNPYVFNATENISLTALFLPNKYKLVYKVDHEVYKSFDVDYAQEITPEEEPTKEGYTFSGWSEIPTTMPAHDVEINGTFAINQYTITFDTDGGSEIAPITQDYNSVVTPPANPTKVGHTFVGWDKEIPLTMPAENITIKALWTVNQYKVSFVADGTVISEETLAYGSRIAPPEAPEKEGHTFAGWKDVPETMPAHDIEIHGSYTVNVYTLTYQVDGKVYKEYTIAFGTEIVPEAFPEKEGYTFSGWEGLPQTMPAHDVVVSGTFAINSYRAVFIIGEDVIETRIIVYGQPVTTPEAPEKEGHTFAGWEDVPETMPAHDIEIHGTYNVNAYTLTYQVDGTVYKTYTVEYGTTIVPEAFPEKEGHTFSGSQGLPDTMPAHDVVASGTFAINSYRAVFIIGEDVIETRTIVYGQPVTTPEAPEKEGHTFAGWEDVPETMPAHDIEIHGTYNVNAYSLTYQVDGTVYKTYTVEYGTAIVPESFPEKEGHTFSGWQGLPDTMPAHDVVASGTFSINSYRAVFIIGEDVIETRTIVYGQPITTPEAPEKEGHTFAGWEDVPETMPAHDIEIYGTYTVNAYKLTVFLDGAIYMEEMLEYGTPITIPDPEVPEGKQFNGWMTEVPETMPAHDLEIYGTTSEKTGISSIVADEQTEVSIYDMKGNLLFKNTSSKGIPNKLSKGIYIVNGKKVLMH